MGEFRFKRFGVKNEASAMKVGTDAVLLGSAMNLCDKDGSRFLDIGTGTGVIALMAAQRCPGATITAIDIDRNSAEEAMANFAASPWPDRLSAICTPLSLFETDCKFERIFSNPPYYDESLKNPDAREATARHTETLSYRELCAFAKEHLSTDGLLSMILPSDCEQRLLRYAASFDLFPRRLLRIRTTPAKGVSRLIAEFGLGKDGSPATGQTLTLLTPGGTRSPEYAQLTTDFYLDRG